MASRAFWYFVGSFALGAATGVLYMQNKEKIKPAAAELLAKSMKLKEKALCCAAKAKEHAEDIVAEAKMINESASGSET